MVDDFTRECVAAVSDTSISGTRVARELDRLLVMRGAPTPIVSDNRPELTSHAILTWTTGAGLDWTYSAPGHARDKVLRPRPVPARGPRSGPFLVSLAGDTASGHQ